MIQDIKPGEVEGLIERHARWLQNTGYDGGPDSPPVRAHKALRYLSTQLAERDRQIAEARGLLQDMLTVLAIEGVCGDECSACASVRAFLASKEQSDG